MPRPPITIPFKSPEPEPAAIPAGDTDARVLSGLLKPPGGRKVVLSGRCGTCGCLLTSPGHKTACG